MPEKILSRQPQLAPEEKRSPYANGSPSKTVKVTPNKNPRYKIFGGILAGS